MGTSVQVVIDCADPARLAAFWAEALHYEIPAPPPGFATLGRLGASPGHPRGPLERCPSARGPRRQRSAGLPPEGPRVEGRQEPDASRPQRRRRARRPGRGATRAGRRRGRPTQGAGRVRRARPDRPARRVLGPDERPRGQRVLRPVERSVARRLPSMTGSGRIETIRSPAAATPPRGGARPRSCLEVTAAASPADPLRQRPHPRAVLSAIAHEHAVSSRGRIVINLGQTRRRARPARVGRRPMSRPCGRTCSIVSGTASDDTRAVGDRAHRLARRRALAR